MDKEIMDRVLAEVTKRIAVVTETVAAEKPAACSDCCVAPVGMPEFIGTTTGDTIGLVIANVEPKLHAAMGIDSKYRSIGIISDRVGAGPQIMAVDEAVKATNSEVISIECPRDTKGGAGHGSLILIGAEDVSDAKRAVEVALANVDKYFGDVWGNDVGYLELQYTARASYCINKAFGAPLGKAYGLILGAPAGIGNVICDIAVKAAEVDIISYCSPTKGTSNSNEAFIHVSGDSGAVRQAILAAREVGVKLLHAMGTKPVSTNGKPYI